MPRYPSRAGALCWAALSAACLPEGSSAEWPEGGEIGFVVTVENGALIEPVLGPFDLSTDRPALAFPSDASVFVVQTTYDRLVERELHLPPEPSAVRLEARSLELASCEETGVHVLGTIELELGAEADVFELTPDGFEPSEANLGQWVSWRLSTSNRCPMTISTSVAPFASTAEILSDSSGPTVRGVSDLVVLSPDHALLVMAGRLAVVERGRPPDPAWRIGGGSLPDPPPAGGYAFFSATRLPPLGSELARLAVAGSQGTEEGNITGWFVAEMVVEPGSIRFVRWMHRRGDIDLAVPESIRANDDGELISGSDGELFYHSAQTGTSTVWVMPKLDLRAVVFTPDSETPHALGGVDGEVWFGDARQGPASMGPPELADPAHIGADVRAMFASSDGLHALTTETLSRRISPNVWQPLPLEIPDDAALCIAPRGENRCRGSRLPRNSMRTAEAVLDGVLVGAETCDALFFRHSDGCVDSVPLMSAPNIEPGEKGVREPRVIRKNGDRWLVGATPAALYELTIETN